MRQDDVDLNDLRSRIQQLEVQNRRWNVISTTAVLVVGSLMLMGAKRDDRVESPTIKASTVESREFVLKDAQGHIRARLSLPPTGRVVQGPGYYPLAPPQVVSNQAALQFYDENGDVVWIAPTSPSVIPLKQ